MQCVEMMGIGGEHPLIHAQCFLQPALLMQGDGLLKRLSDFLTGRRRVHRIHDGYFVSSKMRSFKRNNSGILATLNFWRPLKCPNRPTHPE